MSKAYKAVYIILIAAAGFVIWTLVYGIALAVVYKDARILNITTTKNVFAPIQQIWTYGSNPTLQIVALGSLVPAIVVSLIAAYICLRPHENPLGDAAFQKIVDLRRGKWFRKNGHIFGRFGRFVLKAADSRHHLIIGPTRSGKGAGYVIPNALMHEGSMIVTDLKGEIFKATAGYRKRTGSQVFLFAPGSEKTHRYNPLDFVRPERGNRTTDIQNIAAILVPENIGSENSVWQGLAQQVVAGIISYVLESPYYHDRRNLGEVVSFVNSGVDLQAQIKFIKEKEPNLSKYTVESFNAFLALSDRAAASALLDIQNALRPFRNERIVAATEVTDMDIAAMKRRPISIYLAPNITDITILRPLLTLFVQQVLNILTLEHDPKALPVFFLLDEFRQLKKMDEIMTKLPYVAGYNIKLAIIIQDLKNLDEIYGETSRHSLLGNCGYQLILGANDQATAEYASRALGKRTIRYKSESRTIELVGLPRRTKVEQIRERDLMMPQEIRQLPENKMILLVEGQRPILADKLRFFNTQPFKAAEAYSQSHQPDVPVIEYLPPRAVPALTEDYAKAGDGTEETTSAAPSPTGVQTTKQDIVHAQQPDNSVKITASAASNQESNRAISMKVKLPSTTITDDNPNSRPVDVDARLKEVEAQLKPSAERLLKAVKDRAEDVAASPRKRKSYLEIFNATVPDPEDIGLASATE